MPAAGRPATLPEAFQRTARIAPDAVALRTVGDTQTVMWRDYAARVRQVAAGLAALGVGRGDTVSLMMANRIEFYPLDVAAQHVGATSFSVYNTWTAKRLAHVFTNTATGLVFCEHQYVDRIKASGAPIDIIVCIDGSPEGTISVDDLIAGGSADFDFEATWQAVRPDDVATLIHTSGTTGHPKAVEATHTNLLFEVFGLDEVLGLRSGDRITSFLPTAHTVDRVTALYLQEVIGAQVTVVPDPTTIITALPDVRPTVWGGMPLLWEKLKAAIEATVAAQTGVKRVLGDWALGAASTRARALLDGSAPGVGDRVRYALADKLVLGRIRAAIGLDRAKWLISGDAPIPRETLAFFLGLGLPMTEVWGMSELSGIATVSHPRDAVLGSVGRPLPGLQTKMAADGELLVRGPLVMKGYRNEPEKTAEAIDADGWLHTGDIATLDDDGNVWIIDRKEELITNAAGQKMSPCSIEKTIKAACDLIGAMTIVGDARPFNTALIVLDAETAGSYVVRNGLADASAQALGADPHVTAQIATGVGRGNTKLSGAEQVKRFKVLPVFWEPGGDEMTLTMKLKRKRIAQKYAADIADLYSAEPSSTVHEPQLSHAAREQVRATRTKGTTVEYTVTVDRAVEDTWRFLTDFENVPKWARGVAEIVEISPGPLAVGTTVTDVGLGLKRRWPETFSVEELIPNQVLGLVWRGVYGTAHVRYTLKAAPDGTRLTGSTYGDYRFPFWIILMFMSKTANRNFRAGLENIKTLSEMEG